MTAADTKSAPKKAIKPVKLLIIANPAAGSAQNKQALAKLTHAFEQHHPGIPIEIRHTQYPGHAREIAFNAGPDSLIAAAGGDGTVNEVINGMHASSVLGILPMGTANVAALEIYNNAHDITKAINTIVKGRPAKIDLGLVNTQKFIMSAGLGIDGSVTQNVNTALKKHIHRAAYIIEIFITLFLRRTPRHLVIADIPATTRRPGPVKKTRSLAIVSKSTLVMNTSNYAGRFVLSKNAAINDGLLDICIFRRTDIFFLFYSFFILLFYGPESFSKIPEIFIFQTSGLFIKTKGAPLQIDGDICYSDKSGSIINTPLSLQIKCLKNALNIMIPKA